MLSIVFATFGPEELSQSLEQKGATGFVERAEASDVRGNLTEIVAVAVLERRR